MGFSTEIAKIHICGLKWIPEVEIVNLRIYFLQTAGVKETIGNTNGVILPVNE
jgi:hypothetical protein